jgi:alpha-maltose-1-phosphate synthase
LQMAMRGEPANATYLLQSHIARQLLSLGHDLSFIAQRDLGDNVFTRDPENPESAPLTWSGSMPFELLRKLSWRAQQLLGVPYLNIFNNFRLYDSGLQCLPGHDVVYERNGLFRNGIAMACRRLELPYVLFVEADEISEHDYMGSPLTGLLRRSARRQFRYNLEAADRIICVSDPLKSRLVAVWGIQAGKIIVLPNGVDVVQFQPDHDADRRVRESMGIKDNPLILFVGNFYVWHDVKTLLDSFARVMLAYPDAHLVLVGDGALRKSMEQHSIDIGVSHAVHFTGLISHSEVPGFMASADIAIVPYPEMNQENWLSPLKLFEYMASARPIVASAVGQVADIIRHEKNGLLVPPGDADTMAEAIMRLLADKDLCGRLGRQARNDAAENHSWERYLSCLEKVLYDAIPKAGAK